MQQIEAGQLLLHGGIVDLFGMELLLDVVAHAHLLHGIDVAGAGAERDPVEDVDDFVVIRGLFLGQDDPGRCRKAGEHKRRHAGETKANHTKD